MNRITASKEEVFKQMMSEDLNSKPDQELKEGKIYTIETRSKGKAAIGSNTLKAFFIKKAKGYKGTFHYLFKSVKGGYTISYTNNELKLKDIQIS